MEMGDVQEVVNMDGQALGALRPRERILTTASDLFYRFSIHTVGVDRIIAESGVAKMTFYKHFPSKANLIAEYLRHKTVMWMHMLAVATEQPGLTPIERVLAVFDAMDGSFRGASFRGCPFVKGLAEFGPDADSPEVKATIAAYFQGLRDLIVSLVTPLELTDPDETVMQILSLIQGAIVMAQVTPDPIIARVNRDAARLCIEAGSKASSTI